MSFIAPGECVQQFGAIRRPGRSRRGWQFGGGAPSDPSTIFGASLKQWLRSDIGSISSWTDNSGNGNHATQASGPLQPSIAAGVLNGRSVFRFASTSQMQHALALTSPSSVILVAQYKDVATFAEMYTAGNGFPAVEASVNGGLQWGVFAATQPSSGQAITAGFKTIFIVSRTSADCDLVTSSTLVNVNPGTPAVGTTNFIGKDGGLGDGGAFDIAEVIAINRAITAGERASLLSYTQGLYGVTV